jgi:hypothetical protein
MFSNRDLFDWLKLYVCLRWRDFSMTRGEWIISIIAYPFITPFMLLFMLWSWLTFEDIRKG